jgi:hypothetical protein
MKSKILIAELYAWTSQEKLTGIGLCNFSDFIGVQPDLVFTTTKNLRCQALLGTEQTARNKKYEN